MSMINLLSMNLSQLISWCESLGEKPFRARQLFRWIHQKHSHDFSQMTELALNFREKLSKLAYIKAPAIHQTFYSKDGTVKWLLDVGDGNLVEMVFIPESKRGTLCISSQAGCAVNCRFCSTGKQGFSRNLRTDEIIGQIWLAEKIMRSNPNYQALKADERVITNVVMMGMGEPLLNYEAVKTALGVMLDDHAYGLSRRRVTLSTSGIVPFIEKLGQEMPVSLAVSLHAPKNELRDVLVPINKKYPLELLISTCQTYLKYAPRDFITLEYCMLDDWNDHEEHAYQLIELVKNLPCKFNLIPFNPFPESGLRVSKSIQIQKFAQILSDAGIVTTIRKTRGDDIDAACGQLAGNVQDRTGIEQRVILSNFSKKN